MDRKIATGIVLSTALFSSAFLVIALRTVISPSGGDAASLATAQESMKSSLDAARPDEPAVPAKPAAVPAAKLDTPSWIWAPGAKTEDAGVFTRRARATWRGR
jgi:hypothetical protein